MRYIFTLLLLLIGCTCYCEPIRIIKDIAEVHRHGYRDDNLSFKEAWNLSRLSNLQMTCGSISQYTITLLDRSSVKSRFILFLTLDSWNNYNNGHSLVEVFYKGKWTLYDITFRYLFIQDGKKLNAIQTLDKINTCERHKFSSSPIFAWDDLSYGGVEYSKWYKTLLTKEGENLFYKRCFQVLLIRDNGIFYFTCDPKDRERVESYPYCGPFVYMDRESFMKHFYP